MTSNLQPFFQQSKNMIEIEVGDIDVSGTYPDTKVSGHGCHISSPHVDARNNKFEMSILDDSYFNASVKIKWFNVEAIMNAYFHAVLKVDSDLRIQNK